MTTRKSSESVQAVEYHLDVGIHKGDPFCGGRSKTTIVCSSEPDVARQFDDVGSERACDGDRVIARSVVDHYPSDA
ncbi:MAG TPA: hypothetical protein VIM26_24845 [Pengzhenrongella sp.]